jgi:hypothetical protein
MVQEFGRLANQFSSKTQNKNNCDVVTPSEVKDMKIHEKPKPLGNAMCHLVVDTLW